MKKLLLCINLLCFTPFIRKVWLHWNKWNINVNIFEWAPPLPACNTTDLTLVIMGALFDLRRAPPPVPPAAPAHWSTSIRSIPRSAGPAVAALTAGLSPFDGGGGLYSRPVKARPAGLTSSKPRAAESAGWTPSLPPFYRISLRKIRSNKSDCGSARHLLPAATLHWLLPTTKM